MYPSGELNLLGARKALVRVRIAEHRWQCIQAAGELSKPVEFLDRAWATWKKISPLMKMAGVPLTWMLVKRMKIFGRLAKVASFARTLPVILNTAKAVASWRA
jgi:hypothetical protein